MISSLFFRLGDPMPGDGTLPRELLSATNPRFKLGDWNKIQKDFFSEGGIFDQIYSPAADPVVMPVRITIPEKLTYQPSHLTR